ncbi:hypothetical protein RhiJN_18472 [Ceratobasidium sp. AG-Ba]|nr:hypothetical protein RhiJN_18472 [Ceratobasidium sp. AG-Ba]
MEVEPMPVGEENEEPNEEEMHGHAADGLFDSSQNVFMNNHHEEKLSDAPSSNGSWNEIGTPPPSPPPPPSDSKNNTSSDNKDGYQHITA